MRPILLVLIVLVALPTVARGQSRTLQRIETLISTGDVAAAREELADWWEEGFPSASRQDIQQGYWLRGKLTVDPDIAEVDYTRLVVEFPGGRYSDQALLRLAYASQARGDLAHALEHIRMLLRDYPSSPTRLDAERWLGEFGAEAAAAQPEPPPTTREEEEGRPRRPTAEATGSYTVQVGAFASSDRARTLADQIREEGFETRIVQIPESRWIRVRVGRFQTQAQARELITRLSSLGFDAVLASDVDKEMPVR